MLYLSVDGGATKTLAACYSDDGTIMGVGAAGPSNFRNIGIEAAKSNLESAVLKSLERADAKAEEIKKYTFALARVKDSQRSTEIIESFIGEMDLGKNVIVLNDGEAGFNCRFPGKDGIIAAPGTGMIAYGRKGKTFERASGWGWFIGDEGGAFYTARRAIQESAKIMDGRREIETKAPETLMRFFGVTEPRQLVNVIYREPIDIRTIASFTRELSPLAENGDKLAREILQESARESAKCIIALKRRLFKNEDVQFSGYGGVYRSGDIYWNTLVSNVNEEFPEMQGIRPLYGYHAVIGSIYLVLKSMKKEADFDLENEVADLDRHINGLSEEEKKKYLLIKG